MMKPMLLESIWKHKEVVLSLQIIMHTPAFLFKDTIVSASGGDSALFSHQNIK